MASENSAENEGIVKIAIVSDLHAYDKSALDNKPSYLEISQPSNQSSPIGGLIKLIQDESLSASMLLCPGDLAHQAHPSSVNFAWQEINKLASELNSEVIATAGNHDVDSRYAYNSFDAKGYLQELQPLFPYKDENLFDRYWSRHFCIIDKPNVRFLVLNSSAYHGVQTEKEHDPEYVHGRVSDRTINAIESELRGLDTVPLNIMLCHHHPIPHEEFDLGDHDTMKSGSELIRRLGSGELGDWFIIHGHKHFPKISYAQGTNSVTPVVFASGSLTVKLHAEISSRVRNQFYMLEFSLDEISKYGPVGRFHAWDWIYGSGWQPAQKNSGLPHSGGFGVRENPSVIAKKINNHFLKRKQIKWNEIESAFEEVNFLLPTDLEIMLGKLKNNHRFNVFCDSNQRVIQIDRKP